MTIRITVELDEQEAGALARLCEKFSHGDAKQYLYGHLPADVRSDQAYDMVHATARVEKALLAAGVRGWPWVATGEADLEPLDYVAARDADDAFVRGDAADSA